MNQKGRIVLVLLVISILSFGVGLMLKSSIEIGFCLISEPTCISNLTWVGDGLYYGTGALAVVFFILLFAARAFSAWKKFAVWFIPLAALLFIFYPEPGSGDLFSPYPEQVFQWVSGFYVLISFVIIAWKHFFAHRDS